MNLTKMLAELKAEREGVEQAILVLERLASGSGKRRGRKPKWMSEALAPTTPEKRPATLSAATRARMAAAQRKRRASEKRAHAVGA